FDDSNAWNVTGTNAGTVDGFTFSSIENIAGGSGPDAFVVAVGASVAGTINGSEGTDSLSMTLTNANDTVVIGSGTLTINGVVRLYAGIENLSLATAGGA